jgi:hypothetical protein
MEHKVINEIRRINDIMSGKIVLSEQRIVPQILKKIFNVVDDDVARKVMRSTDDSYDDIIRKLRGGKTLSDDAMELLLKVIDYDFLAKSLVDQKLLGDELNKGIERFINILKENPGRYDELTAKIDDVIDTFGFNEEFPEELIDAIKKDVRSKIDNAVDVTKKSLSSGLATQTSKLLQKFGYTRNLGRLISVMSDYKKGKLKLISEIENLINSSLEGTDNISKITREIENKLLSIESISDNAAKSAVTDITNYFSQLRKSGKITKGDYEKVITHFEEVKKGDIWKQVIDPLNSEIEKGISGWSSVRKKLVPLRRVKNKETGKVVWTWEDKTFTRLVNFLVFQSTQTGLDILKRFITKKNGKHFFGQIPLTKTTKVVIETYLRAIVFKAIIPILAPAYYTFRFKTSDYAVTDLEVDNVLFSPEKNEKLRDMMKKSWEESIDNDGFFNRDSELTSWTANDFIPALSTYIDDIAIQIKNWTFSSDKSQSTNSANNNTTTTTTTQLEYTLDAVKSAAPERVKPGLWQSGNDILIASINSDGEDVDYKISIENNQYMVDIGTRKIKLSDYYKTN